MKHLLFFLFMTACFAQPPHNPQSRQNPVKPARLGNTGLTGALNLPQVTRIDSQTIQIGANCATQNPCLFTDTYTTYAVSSECTFHLIGSAVTSVNFVMDAYGFVALTNTGGQNSIIGDSSACEAVPESPQNLPNLMDPGSIILATFSTTNGLWNPLPDMTAALLHTWTFQSNTLDLTTSMNAVSIELPQGLRSVTLQQMIDQPPQKGAACFPGTWTLDDNYLYRCAGSDPSQQTGHWRVIPFTDWQ